MKVFFCYFQSPFCVISKGDGEKGGQEEAAEKVCWFVRRKSEFRQNPSAVFRTVTKRVECAITKKTKQNDKLKIFGGGKKFWCH